MDLWLKRLKLKKKRIDFDANGFSTAGRITFLSARNADTNQVFQLIQEIQNPSEILKPWEKKPALCRSFKDPSQQPVVSFICISICISCSPQRHVSEFPSPVPSKDLHFPEMFYTKTAQMYFSIYFLTGTGPVF